MSEESDEIAPFPAFTAREAQGASITRCAALITAWAAQGLTCCLTRPSPKASRWLPLAMVGTRSEWAGWLSRNIERRQESSSDEPARERLA